MPDTPTWGLPYNFLGLEPEFSAFDTSRVALLPVPYDFSTSYQSGTRWGPQAILTASRNMEMWDDELGATYRSGIHTLPELETTALGPGDMARRVEQAFDWIYDAGKLPLMLGGEHSITAGGVRAALKRFPKLSVLQLDAHADMRDRYLDSPDSHACVMRRIRELCPAASVGIRSLSEEEAAHLKLHPAPLWNVRTFRKLQGDWRPILDALTNDVFITFDLDGLDPAYLPGTGTPEPGGLDWYEASDLIAAVAASKRIVGCDVVELAPLPGNVASDFLAARMTYRMIGHMLKSQEVVTTVLTTPKLVLRRGEDRRVRGGHPWIFSNEVESWQGGIEDGGMVDVNDYRGAFLGQAYVNRHSLICARLLTRGREEIDTAFFVKRFERAKRLRDAVCPGEPAVRLVYGESDQLPGLVVDRYAGTLAVQVLTLGMEKRLPQLRVALEQVFEPTGVVLVADSPLRALEGLDQRREVWWGDVPERVAVQVGGFALEADLVHGQKTGLFLDQRENRRRAEARAEGRSALDVFCYQGEWSMHLARGGASSVLAVDSSEPALALARANVARNSLSEQVQLIRSDAFDALRKLEREGKRFGIIVMDPPALIKSRRAIAAGARAYREHNRLAMGLLEEDGILVTCSCSHHLDDDMFRQVLLESARAAKRPMRVLDWAGEAADHPRLLAVPETHYLKCAVLQAL